jgi:predicted RNA-binding Zn ribbon-like protein
MANDIQTRKRGADPTFPRLLGDRVCLDFANTIEGPRSPRPEEFLRSYSDLVRWGRHADILSEAVAGQLLLESARMPSEAATVFERALALRGSITKIFRAIAAGAAPEESDLRRLQSEYLRALEQVRLAPADDHFDWDWAENEHAFDRPLWAIARSAVEVLTTDNFARVKECPGADDCGWLFYDTSKNGSRRWCSMEGCGSRLKMRRQYAKRKGAEAG